MKNNECKKISGNYHWLVFRMNHSEKHCQIPVINIAVELNSSIEDAELIIRNALDMEKGDCEDGWNFERILKDKQDFDEIVKEVFASNSVHIHLAQLDVYLIVINKDKNSTTFKLHEDIHSKSTYLLPTKLKF